MWPRTPIVDPLAFGSSLLRRLGMVEQMMDGMIWPMWALWLTWLLIVAALVLAAAALGKYLFSSGKKG